jgi:transposase
MSSDVIALPNDVEALKKTIENLTLKVEILEKEIKFYRNKLFGRKSEVLNSTNEAQQELFDEAEMEVQSEAASDTKEEETYVSGHTRKKRGRRPLPESLPRKEVVHDLEDEEKICACGAELERIGEDTSEELEIIPARVKVIRHIRPKYVCKACEGVQTEEEGGAVKIAPPPIKLIPKSISTPGLLAHIFVSKFEDALPFYRQEKMFDRIGIDLSRQTMSFWAIRAGEICTRLVGLMWEEIRSGPIVNIDETPVQVMREPNRKNTQKSYMWVFRGGCPEKPTLIYQYEPTRSGSVPLIALKDFEGYVQVDGYPGYDQLGEQPGIILLGCLAHVRRKFFDLKKACKNSPSATQALGFISRLYAVEHKADAEKLSAADRKKLREKLSGPILESFKKWLDKQQAAAPPKSLLGKAVGYALGQWDRIIRYLDDGLLRPDNNLVENAIRPFVVGRKNWEFFGSPDGADASSALYSLIETAKACGLEPYWYLRYLFEQLPHVKSKSDMKALLPQYLDREKLYRL